MAAFRSLVWALAMVSSLEAATRSGTPSDGRSLEQPVHFIGTGEALKLRSPKPVRWYQVTPVLKAYDNLPQLRPSLAPIHYRRSLMPGPPRRELRLSFHSPGTRYFCAGPVVPERFTDLEPLQRRYAGKVVQVVVRTGDDYSDYLTELFGTPFIMAPAPTAVGWHQTDQRVGSDCAAFATYGRRRMGEPVPYAGPGGIVRYLRPLASSPFTVISGDGTYRDSSGRTMRVGFAGIRRGDIVHFGPQVSVFHTDRGVRGRLDAEDMLIQSWRTTPHITTLRASGFYEHPVRLYRWR